MHMNNNENMGSSAASRFASLPELLQCLVDQIPCSKHLAALRLVNRTFHNVATRVLFRAVHVARGPNSDVLNFAKTITALAEEAHLVQHVRSFSVGYIDRQFAPAANRAVQDLLVEMPLLEAFRCACPILPETVRILHRSCRRLKSLSLDFERMEDSVLDFMEDNPNKQTLEARRLFTIPDLTVFADMDLEELSLLHLFGDVGRWRDQIVTVLKSSPNLKRLALSLSADAISHLYSDQQSDKYWGWFESLCTGYIDDDDMDATQLSPPPLRLRSLFCGTAVFPNDDELLEQFIDLTSLEEVLIDNRDIWNDHNSTQMMIVYGEDDESDIVFEPFVNAPNLRRLKVTNYAGDVHRAFCSIQNPDRVRQIAISCRESGEGYEPAGLLRPDSRYPALPLHPRMLGIDLDRKHDNILLFDEDGEEDYNVPSADEVLHSLVNGDEGTIEGLVLYLPAANRPDDDDPPTLEGQLALLARYLPRLTNLSQLCIHGRGYNVDDGYTDVAGRLALAIPSLRYINVRMSKQAKDKNYRRIIRQSQNPGVTLVELEGKTENETVELYRMSLHERMSVYGP